MESTKKAGCAFCKRLTRLRRFHKSLRDEYEFILPFEIGDADKCAISYYWAGKRTVDGYDFNLNFCPECGRRLNMGKRI